MVHKPIEPAHSELLSLCGVNVRPMFGGLGYFDAGKMFGLVHTDKLYLRAGETNVADYLIVGQMPFVHEVHGEHHALSFYSVPRPIIEEPELLRGWAEKALNETRRVTSRQRISRYNLARRGRALKH
ncbi:TfoX family protein [Rhodobacteraceae bacterium RKSG542]|uniref:TfoX/Sxy family protein n=1 Tax=Pseudovibrio flavus TaxID=2529854 RepID=UPI0012BCCF87|nr:TfoX/Sxy family protein [Pseudovibrio flavus]MTI15787.1 TfoX family protein [Pseudovibrio flavus]